MLRGVELDRLSQAMNDHNILGDAKSRGQFGVQDHAGWVWGEESNLGAEAEK